MFLTVTLPIAALTPIPVPAIIDSTALVAPTSIQPAAPPPVSDTYCFNVSDVVSKYN